MNSNINTLLLYSIIINIYILLQNHTNLTTVAS